MLKFLFTIIFVVAVFVNYTQDTLSNENTSRKNAFIFELAGNGALFSLSYDRTIFSKENQSLHGRVGYGFLFNIVFIEGSYVYGNKHCFEQGLSYGHDFSTHWDMYYRLGYRYEGNKGLLIRVAPLLHYNVFSGNPSPFDIWYGISIGTSF